MTKESLSKEWFPENLLVPPLLQPHSLILLNSPLQQLEPLFSLHWKRSSLKVAADGGANCLYDLCLVPDVVVGITQSKKGYEEDN